MVKNVCWNGVSNPRRRTAFWWIAVGLGCGLVLAAPRPAAAQTPAEPEKPVAAKTGDFTFESYGVRRTLFIEVLQRFREPASAELLQKLLAEEEALQRKLKSAIVSRAKPEPPKPAPTDKEKEKEKPSRWRTYVPAAYDGVAPYGVVAYVNSAETSALPNEYKPLLDARRLIWVSAEAAGNDTSTIHRMAVALEGVRRLRDQGYVLDADRIYVSGISGGGRVASNMGLLFPDFVTGGIYLAGINAYRDVPAGGGSFLPKSVSPTAPLLNAAKERRHVVVFGKKDKVAGYVPTVAQEWARDGFRNFLYLELPELGHSIPPAAEFDKALAHLDAPLASTAKKDYDAATAALKKIQLGRALDGFRQALAHAPEAPFAADARTQAIALLPQYAAALAACEAAAATGDLKKFSAESIKFKRTWEPLAAQEMDRLAIMNLHAREAK